MHRPQVRKKPSWYGDHVRGYNKIIKEQAEVVLLGDSLVVNLSRYPIVWDHLDNLNSVNCGIRGDHTQNVLWPGRTHVSSCHCFCRLDPLWDK